MILNSFAFYILLFLLWLSIGSFNMMVILFNRIKKIYNKYIMMAGSQRANNILVGKSLEVVVFFLKFLILILSPLFILWFCNK